VAGEKKKYGEEIRTLLGVPGSYTLVSLIAAGMPAEISITQKKELGKIVFHDCYNTV
jgi:hypothetical protein